jgi:dephospho-CoA kinase
VTYLIGLTGNIATGKSLVARMLRSLGAHVIDADALVHELQRKGTPVWARVVGEFGEGIQRADGALDRAKLGALVFSKPEALHRLESIVHPAVGAEIERQLANLEPPDQVVVVEAIKLIEVGLHKRCDALWVVTSQPEVQLKRLMRTRGLSEADAQVRIAAQPPQSEKIALADVVIENDVTVSKLRAQVERHWKHVQVAMGRRGASQP